MAPGRWGSADKSQGIPVSWSHIDSSAFIVETQAARAQLCPSPLPTANPNPQPQLPTPNHQPLTQSTGE